MSQVSLIYTYWFVFYEQIQAVPFYETRCIISKPKENKKKQIKMTSWRKTRAVVAKAMNNYIQ